MHCKLLAALRADIEKVVHVLGHLAVAAVCHAGFFVPCIVVLTKVVVELCHDFFFAELGQFFCCEKLVYNHVDFAAALVETVLGACKVAAVNMGAVNRNLA